MADCLEIEVEFMDMDNGKNNAGVMGLGEPATVPTAAAVANAVFATPMLTAYIAVGTGYGMEQDWRHGMYQWELVVQGFTKDVAEIAGIGQYGVGDHVAQFDASDGRIGYGLHEHGFWGAFGKYGMNDPYSGAK